MGHAHTAPRMSVKPETARQGVLDTCSPETKLTPQCAVGAVFGTY